MTAHPAAPAPMPIASPSPRWGLPPSKAPSTAPPMIAATHLPPALSTSVFAVFRPAKAGAAGTPIDTIANEAANLNAVPLIPVSPKCRSSSGPVPLRCRSPSDTGLCHREAQFLALRIVPDLRDERIVDAARRAVAGNPDVEVAQARKRYVRAELRHPCLFR